MQIDVKWRFWLPVGLMFLVLAGLGLSKQRTVLTGDTIMLRTVPVDPRSLFRGDYVVLRYEISSLDLGELAFGSRLGTFAAGDTVYVVLEPDGTGVYDAVTVARRAPDLAYGQATLRGTVQSTFGAAPQQTLAVEYGIESYFVPEGTGREIERARGDSLRVEVAVDGGGRGVVRQVLVDGEPFVPGGEAPTPHRVDAPTPQAPAQAYPYPYP
ncbi:MAG: GDYXXLXY domain-containing protein [Anaerolineae bacterium]